MNEEEKEGQMNRYFRRCFPVENVQLREYMKLVGYRMQIRPKCEFYTEFHIVPKDWFGLNDEKDAWEKYGKRNANNLIYVTFEEELRLYLILLYYFAGIDDERMYVKIRNILRRRTGAVGCGGLNQLLQEGGGSNFTRGFYGMYQEYWLRKMRDCK